MRKVYLDDACASQLAQAVGMLVACAAAVECSGRLQELTSGNHERSNPFIDLYMITRHIV